MKYLIKPGLITFGSYSGTGKLLVTDSHLFGLSEDNSAGRTGGVVGGAVGSLIGSAIDSLSKRGNQPEFLNDPDLSFLDDSTKKPLRKTDLLVKLKLDDGLTVTPTFAGFDFVLAGFPPLQWRGLIHKGKVRQFLEANGIAISKK